MGGAIKETRVPTPDLERSSEGDLGELNDSQLEIGSRTSTRRPLIASHCFSLPLIASNCRSCARGSSAMRPPAIASAVAATLARAGNLRFQTRTIHKQERDGKARSSSRARRELHERRGGHTRARSERRGGHERARRERRQPPTRRSRKTCEVWGFGAGVGF
jgi:hypothetical protein